MTSLCGVSESRGLPWRCYIEGQVCKSRLGRATVAKDAVLSGAATSRVTATASTEAQTRTAGSCFSTNTGGASAAPRRRTAPTPTPIQSRWPSRTL